MQGLIIFIIMMLAADRLAAGEAEYLPTVWGVEEGLPQHVVGAIAQTTSGDLWCGTFNGLARFDGVKFTIFDENSIPGLAGRGVTALYEDRQGTLWVGSDSGGVTRVVDRAPVPTPRLVNRGQGSVLSIGEDASGDLWILWQDGSVVRWRDDLRIAPTPDIALMEPELRLVRDGAGLLWLTHRYGFSEVKPSGLVPAATGLTRDGWGLQRAAAAQRGGLWVVSELKLRRWQDGAWVEDLGPCPWNPAEGPDYPFVSVMRELKDGRLLAGMVDGGMALGIPGKPFRRYTREDGLPHDWIRCATEDREGNLWLGTGGGGLVALRSRRVRMLTVESGAAPPNAAQHNILSLLPAADGSFWVATEGGGLFLRAPGEGSAFIRQESLPTRYIWAVNQDQQGRIWAGTWGHGLFLRGQDNSFSPAPGWPEGNPRATVLRVTRDGTVWAGGAGPLHHLTAEGWQSKAADGGLFAPPGQRAISEDSSGGLWIGLNDGRLLHRHGGKEDFYDRRHGLPGDAVITVLAGADGIVWLGTGGGGLLRLKDGHAARFTTAQGLPHNVISQILSGPDGYLWLGTYGGLCRLSLAELEACAAGQLPQLNALTLRRSDGMATVECTSGGHPGACTGPDGRLWFPTNKGIAIVDPGKIVLNLLPPPVIMESLLLDGRPLPLTSGVLELGPGVERVGLAYTALSFTAPDRVRFRTRLDGLETAWQEAGSERTASYRYLPPGAYTFRVMACNNDGVWNPVPATLAFQLRPYWWQRGLYQGLGTALAALSLATLVWTTARRRNAARLERLERVHALERERARIARDIHDDLGSGLTRIMLLSESARSELPPASAASVDVESIRRAADDLTRAMDEIVWAVDPRHDSLDSLVGYIGSTAQEFLKTANLRFRLEAPGQLPAWPLTAECRHSLFLAFREALHNVIRHAQAQTVRVVFAVEENAFTLTIEDDGRGFDPTTTVSRPGGGRGLHHMQDRLAELGGTCHLTSFPGQGTRVTFRIPVTVPPLS